MPAKFISIGKPANDGERQALRFLIDGLPDTYTIYGNPWLVERTGQIYELDAVVMTPQAIFVVEIKSYRGRILGTDHDWFIPEPIASPLKLNRLTAQILKGLLKRDSLQAGHAWVEGFVFLSATTDVRIDGDASVDRVHTRKTILTALQNAALVRRLSNRNVMPPTEPADRVLLRLLQGIRGGPIKPVRRIREYEIIDTIEQNEGFTELLGRNSLSSIERVLRVYTVAPLALEAQRDKVKQRARWEAQVLGRLGRLDGILNADPPFEDEAGIVLPMEVFRGVTLPTWIKKYGPDSKEKVRADLRTRVRLWERIAEIIDDAHQQGVVHRLLRPEVILVDDRPTPSEIRITGFDLAKQLPLDRGRPGDSVHTSFSLTTIADDRLVMAAPEVVNAFSSAEPASDQFSLGALLALLLTGKPLFDSTRQLMAARRLMRRVRDVNARIPLSLDEAVTKMLALRPTDRFLSIGQACSVVQDAFEPVREAVLPGIAPAAQPPLEPEDLTEGTRIGADYEIAARLGQGGLAVVYAARHLPSGRTRALKIARSEDSAEEALRGEYQALSTLDHANIVRVIDLTKMVEGRLTLVMERVGGLTLRDHIAKNGGGDPSTQRQMAEDLLAGLDYLEQKGITHKDLKPDNLLVNEGHLTIIDFSLAGFPADAVYGGTALYRDPSSARWTHGTDRFAAALCLFELYAGRHAFNGHVPEPGEAPDVRDEDIDPPGLAAFFRKALDPVPEKRFPSAVAMREALLVALGQAAAPTPLPSSAEAFDATTPLQMVGLSRRSLNALSRCQVRTVGELMALTPDQVRAIHAIGSKSAAEIIALQDAMRARNIGAVAPPERFDPPVASGLVDCPEPVRKLALQPHVLAAFDDAKLTTIGAVARLTRADLLKLSGVGPKSLAQVVEALRRFEQRTEGASDLAYTLDRLFDQATAPLTDAQRTSIERVIGLTGPPTSQSALSAELGRSQPQISIDMTEGLKQLDTSVLADPIAAFDTVLDSFGGIAPLTEMGHRFEEAWPAGEVSGEGFVRLIVRITPGQATLVELDEADGVVVARPVFTKELLRAFTCEVMNLTQQWPPVEPETARRQLADALPQFEGDALALGVRMCGDVQVTETGHMFIPPPEPCHSIGFVLELAREPIALDDLERRVRRMFNDLTPYPDTDHLIEILRTLDCRVQGDMIYPGRTGSVVAEPALPADAMPAVFGATRTAEETVRDMLRDAAGSRGFRMLVTPPERHTEIARSVASALKATWVSFEDAFFRKHGPALAALERAERFAAQRAALTEAAEETLFDLLDEHGRSGHAVVLGDTGLLALCDALDLPRRLYDETLSGGRGFWVLVVPGVIHKRQPRFNEGPPLWHLEGATLQVLQPLPT